MEQLTPVRELTKRQLDGLTVTLWWVKGTMDTFVTVDDTKTGNCSHYEIPVVPPITPNEVFNHPFSYLPEVTEAFEAYDNRASE